MATYLQKIEINYFDDMRLRFQIKQPIASLILRGSSLPTKAKLRLYSPINETAYPTISWVK